MSQSLKNISDFVEVKGEKYKINTDFKVWIEIEHLLFDKSKSYERRLAEILILAYPILPPDPLEAINGVLWFYTGGEVKTEGGEDNILPSYDLSEDFDYVWGAFLGEFGIDITEKYLHWWKFRTLLLCLGDESRFSKIVGYRTMDISSIKDKNMKRFYEKMKRKFSLKIWDDPLLKEKQTALRMESLFD